MIACTVNPWKTTQEKTYPVKGFLPASVAFGVASIVETPGGDAATSDLNLSNSSVDKTAATGFELMWSLNL